MSSSRSHSGHPVLVVGGGLAGCEAAFQLARAGASVRLLEMRPVRSTEAPTTGDLAELVCSNTLKSMDYASAPGILKNELRMLGSMVVSAAGKAAIPGGKALTVDRSLFSDAVAGALDEVGVVRETGALAALPGPGDGSVILATGPLTTPELSASLAQAMGEEQLYFYDAIAPIVDRDTVDPSCSFWQDRYDEEGEGAAYLNCPMNKEEYEAFIDALLAADSLPGHTFEDAKFFQGCQPIEAIAEKGRESLRFGPMKPVGLRDPRTGRRPWAVLQLRHENSRGTAMNLVGFQTRLRYGMQSEVFRLIPALRNASFHRLGSIHRNTFVCSPEVLDDSLRLRAAPHIRLAGQITGCEGYTESSAVGLLAALSLMDEWSNREWQGPPSQSMLGALYAHLREPPKGDYQPMNVNFGLLPASVGGPKGRRGRKARRSLQAQAALKALDGWARSRGVRSAHPMPEPPDA